MAEGELKMSRRERQRLLVMHEVKSARLSLKEAAGQMLIRARQNGMSIEQAERLARDVLPNLMRAK